MSDDMVKHMVAILYKTTPALLVYPLPFSVLMVLNSQLYPLALLLTRPDEDAIAIQRADGLKFTALPASTTATTTTGP